MLKDHPEQYITDLRFTKDQIQTLFSLRSKTYSCKLNFLGQYIGDLLCNLCQLSPCEQAHITECPKMLENINIDQQILSKLSQDMIFGTTDRQLQYIQVFEKFASVRYSLLEKC